MQIIFNFITYTLYLDKNFFEALQKIRYEDNVEEEIQEMLQEANTSGSSSENISILGLFKDAELRWPLITTLTLQVTQQLCGINAVSLQ
jgi:hypothetical protein